MRIQQGLTLLELLVALVIISIVALVGIPDFSGWNCKRNQQAEFDQLAGLLGSLRNYSQNALKAVRYSTVQPSIIQIAKEGQSVSCLDDDDWESIDVASENLVIPNLNKLSLAQSETVCFYPDDFDGFATSSEFLLIGQCGDTDSTFTNFRITTLAATGLVRKYKRSSSDAEWVQL